MRDQLRASLLAEGDPNKNRGRVEEVKRQWRHDLLLLHRQGTRVHRRGHRHRRCCPRPA
jgi:hypothetical protein